MLCRKVNLAEICSLDEIGGESRSQKWRNSLGSCRSSQMGDYGSMDQGDGYELLSRGWIMRNLRGSLGGLVIHVISEEKWAEKNGSQVSSLAEGNASTCQ
jgi:hypothetical protein